NIIASKIIPTISSMMRYHPMSMATMLSKSCLSELGLSVEFNCADIISSDAFFDAAVCNMFTFQPRDLSLWSPCLGIQSLVQPIPVHQVTFEELLTPSDFRSYTPPLSDMDEESTEGLDVLSNNVSSPPPAQCYRVLTSFNRHHPCNLRFPALQGPKERETWSKKERLHAVTAPSVQNLEDLKQQLSNIYNEDGVKHAPEHYIGVPMEALEG
ncbi:hypothetical protein M404DRAFT_141295, partial [Pisolithus tinctorius Marx 270]